MSKMPEWVMLNNMVVDAEGKPKDLSKDAEAARSYFLNYVNKHTRFFHETQEKISYLVENNYYESEFLEAYTAEEIDAIYEIAYSYKFRFPSYMSAFKFYNDYALKSDDKKEILERYEDRMAIVALYHSDGDFEEAKRKIHGLMRQDFTPATPTLLNTGRKRRGEFVSCFLMQVGDSLNDISRNSEFGKQLSKGGGGVSFDLTNIRARKEAIKDVDGVTKGVVGVAKGLEYDSIYADQMG